MTQTITPRGAGGRRDDLRRLATALALLQGEVERIRAGTNRLAVWESRRPLTSDEAAEARRLRTENRRLTLELDGLRREFVRVQARLA